MNVVADLADFLREHGVDVLLGSSLVLAVFVLLVACTRSPAGKRRLAGLAMAGIVAYGVVALVPLPRLSLRTAEPAAAAAPGTPAEGFRTPAPMPLPAGSENAVSENTVLVTLPPAPVGAAPESIVPMPPPADPAVIIAWGLLVGGALVVLHLLLGWLRLRRIITASREAPAELCRAAEVPGNVRLLIADRRVQPFCCGFRRGCIVLPPNLGVMSPETLFVVRHEVAHLVAGDVRMRVLAAWLRPLLFWQPLFWWLQGQLRFTGEVLADDAAAEGAVGDYVRCMMALASKSAPRVDGTLAAFVFHRPSELYRRLQMMLQREREGSLSTSTSRSPWRRMMHGVSATAIVAVAAMLFGVERAAAQDPARVQRLLDEIDSLRTTIQELRAEVDSLRAKGPENPFLTDREVAGVLSGQTPAKAGQTYRIRKGDTLAGIAKEVLGSSREVGRLRALNPGLDPERLRVGALLSLAEAATPEASSAISRIAAQPGVTEQSPTPKTTPSNHASIDHIANVVTRCIALRGEVQIAEIELSRAEQGVAEGTGTKYDLEIALIRLRTKTQQHHAIETMLRSELDRAKREFARAEQLYKKGFVTAGEVASVSSFVEMLSRAF